MNVIGPFATKKKLEKKTCCDWIIFFQVLRFEYSHCNCKVVKMLSFLSLITVFYLNSSYHKVIVNLTTIDAPKQGP